MRSDPGRSLDRRGLSNRAGFRRPEEKLTDRTVPDAAIPGGPGYHTSHGEVTKCAPEASVFSGQDSHAAGWGGSKRGSDPVGPDVPDWWVRHGTASAIAGQPTDPMTVISSATV